MDEWLFITLAKAKADARPAVRVQAHGSGSRALTKVDVAEALDFRPMFKTPAFRVVLSFAAAAFVTVLLLSAVDDEALQARTPRGEVTVAQLEPIENVRVSAQLSQAQ